MKRPLLVLSIAPLAAAVVLAGCGGGSSSSGGGGGYGSAAPASAPATTPAPAPASAAGARVALATHGVGPMLVDAQGRTLYLWKADTTNKSACSGGCAAGWPPVTTNGKPTAGAGVAAKLLGTTKRADGTTQVTYAGHPLYRFAGDTAAGQLNGQGSDGFGAEWWVVGPGGAAITKTA